MCVCDFHRLNPRVGFACVFHWFFLCFSVMTTIFAVGMQFLVVVQ